MWVCAPPQVPQYFLHRIPRSREVRQSWLSTVLTTLHSACLSLPLTFRVRPDLVRTLLSPLTPPHTVRLPERCWPVQTRTPQALRGHQQAGIPVSPSPGSVALTCVSLMSPGPCPPVAPGPRLGLGPKGEQALVPFPRSRVCRDSDPTWCSQQVAHSEFPGKPTWRADMGPGRRSPADRGRPRPVVFGRKRPSVGSAGQGTRQRPSIPVPTLRPCPGGAALARARSLLSRGHEL